jgi:hypothetical protein
MPLSSSFILNETEASDRNYKLRKNQIDAVVVDKLKQGNEAKVVKVGNSIEGVPVRTGTVLDTGMLSWRVVEPPA